VIVSGSADAGDAIFITRNSVQVAQATAAGDGSFSLSIALSQGANQLQATAQSSCGAQANSNLVTVIRNKQPASAGGSGGGSLSSPSTASNSLSSIDTLTGQPAITPQEVNTAGNVHLAILAPKDHYSTPQSHVMLVGQAPAGSLVYVEVNSRPVGQLKADDEGSFRLEIGLDIGLSQIKVRTASPEAEASVTVERRASSAPGAKASFWHRGRPFLIAISVGLIIFILLWVFVLS
jgi:hypothetical protein